jgi:hypothetical protein
LRYFHLLPPRRYAFFFLDTLFRLGESIPSGRPTHRSIRLVLSLPTYRRTRGELGGGC